jgi:hypothetical protein
MTDIARRKRQRGCHRQAKRQEEKTASGRTLLVSAGGLPLIYGFVWYEKLARFYIRWLS